MLYVVKVSIKYIELESRVASLNPSLRIIPYDINHSIEVPWPTHSQMISIIQYITYKSKAIFHNQIYFVLNMQNLYLGQNGEK